LFEQYKFLNQELKFKDLKAIFENEIPPSGAGDCAAPKLIQYAFKNEYALVCMADFGGVNPCHRNSKPSEFLSSLQRKV
jgi:tRNA pseudouridine32 synthase/23S rRNA pseudouridine746 synthase